MLPYQGIYAFPDVLLPNLYKRSKTLYVAWRTYCHILGSVVLVYGSHLLALITGYTVPFYIFLLLVVWMTYQEFYLHPKRYKQKLWKGILDWFSWILPFTFYFYLLL